MVITSIKQSIAFHPSKITKKEIKEALLRKCQPISAMEKRRPETLGITSIKQSIAFHYTLETFTERRATASICEPFRGVKASTEDMGSPPAIDDIPAVPPELFRSHVYHQEIPYTASLSTCDECDGGGKYECPTCRGQGWEFCPYCRGNKWYPLAVDSFEGDCVKCQGSGERT
ncbi:hypothetical protein JTE90_000427, partial [Oedothorax gibbosus]